MSGSLSSLPMSSIVKACGRLEAAVHPIENRSKFGGLLDVMVQNAVSLLTGRVFAV